MAVSTSDFNILMVTLHQLNQHRAMCSCNVKSLIDSHITERRTIFIKLNILTVSVSLCVILFVASGWW
jgi:hypothetical protein